MRILVTGASGRIGSFVATHLTEAGHEVVATDVVYKSGLAVPVQVADLCDYTSIYPLVEGCDAVIQLGNHAGPHSVRPSQRMMNENVAMNANVFYAALDVGVRRIVGISTIQVMLGRHASLGFWPPPQPCRLPYLPIDGQTPRNPGNNEYALSKIFAEQTLEAMTAQHEDLAAIALRLPLVLTPQMREMRWRSEPLKRDDRRLNEALCYIMVEDVATALLAMVERANPGYRQYFLSQSLAVQGLSLDELAAQYFPDQEIRGVLSEDGGLVDLSELKEDFDWSPAKPRIEIERDLG
ncbi:MAG: NAD(P)-dependent oxidoreductase [Planctomycetota bacterium]